MTIGWIMKKDIIKLRPAGAADLFVHGDHLVVADTHSLIALKKLSGCGFRFSKMPAAGRYWAPLRRRLTTLACIRRRTYGT